MLPARPYLIAVSFVIAAVIFTVDISLPLGVAGGVPYVAVVLISLWSHVRGYTLFISAVCSILVVVGYYSSPPGGITWMVISNRFLALMAIWVTAILGQAHKKAEEKVMKARDELEIKVKERTADLRNTNEALQAEIAGHKRAEEAKEELQAQLLHSQKMEAIGRLAGGIAHDFNNILVAVRTFSNIGMKRFRESTPPAYDIFEYINTASYRATNLTRRLLTFSRKNPTKFAGIDMNKLINDLLRMLTRIIGEDVSIIADLDAGLWTVMGDSAKMEQVITNLFVNARDAMPQGGTITIKAENMTIDKEYCTKMSRARPGRFIHLMIEDTGIGIDKKHIAHIFEPFFTTKKSGTSSGLGLSVVYGILEEHKGWINIQSEPGQGSTFEVYLPAVDIELAKEIEDTYVIKDLRGSGELILLVEHEKLVRKSIMMSLIDEGYTVLGVATAKEAIDIFKEEEGGFHLIISDCILPDKNGLQLIEELISINPHHKAILYCGYMDKQADLSKIEKAGIMFLSKPFDMEDLLRAIKTVLRPASQP